MPKIPVGVSNRHRRIISRFIQCNSTLKSLVHFRHITLTSYLPYERVNEDHTLFEIKVDYTAQYLDLKGLTFVFGISRQRSTTEGANPQMVLTRLELLRRHTAAYHEYLSSGQV